MITFRCQCGQSYTVSDDKAGKKSSCKKCSAPIVVPELVLGDNLPLDLPAPEGGDSSKRLLVATLGVVGGLVVLGVALSFVGSFWESSRPTQVHSSPSSVPPAPPANDDLRAIRQSVERQEAVAKDERREKARKEAIAKQLKELDELGRWNDAQHKRIKAQDQMLRP
jgi:hypothetical protein